MSTLSHRRDPVTEVIRPAAIVPEEAARTVLLELARRDVQNGGVWESEPTTWSRWDRPWSPSGDVGGAQLLGSLHVAYGTPTRYEITIYRITVTVAGIDAGWTVESLCDEALGYGGLTLGGCPRAVLQAPPRPFRH
ncbi:hypothetical protein ACUN7V_05330 [Quadrisphaera oryzae]|uniref:hypothetical protein n=1 Tax=Quadrisphaera TaxID=317661 RepID=UPI0016480D29|nr:hypothetical protein [Quadrisphaera sp. RL12-1S]MBC3762946.1 hypothetical protein [Quadrisphaera sp. RL12-1S]